MIETYLHRFSNLRTDKARNRYPAFTLHRAPHKPFLLLSVMDLIVQGLITENFVEPSFELVDTFNLYWSQIMSAGSKTSMAYPFPRLKTDGFWHLVPNPGYETKIDMQFSSMTKLREVCAAARMDGELFQMMCVVFGDIHWIIGFFTKTLRSRYLSIPPEYQRPGNP